MSQAIESADTFPKLLAERARTDPDRAAFREKAFGIWQSYDWRHVAQNVESLAVDGVILGFGSGDRLIIGSHWKSSSELRENEDVKEFYLGVGGEGRRSFRDVKHYRRRKRWL